MRACVRDDALGATTVDGRLRALVLRDIKRRQRADLSDNARTITTLTLTLTLTLPLPLPLTLPLPLPLTPPLPLPLTLPVPVPLSLPLPLPLALPLTPKPDQARAMGRLLVACEGTTLTLTLTLTQPQPYA